MNLLAHAYLSFGQPQLLVGNMISDYVKGKKQYDYPLGIQQGIRLHRAIDAFTDSHAATAKGKAIFKPAVGLYAGAFMDVVYAIFWLWILAFWMKLVGKTFLPVFTLL